MQLAMYLGEQQIDAVDVVLVGMPAVQQRCIQEGIQQLLKKHKLLLTAAAQQPTFFISRFAFPVNSSNSLLQ